MPPKSFQIVMEPKAHKRLKARANQLNLSIGEMVGNLISVFEHRLGELQKGIEISYSSDSMNIEKQLMELLLNHDGGKIDDQAFKTELKKITDSLKTAKFKIDIKLSKDTPIAKKK